MEKTARGVADDDCCEMESPADDGRSRSCGREHKSGGKSCTGCLYYSSILNSKSRNPRCIGISRTLNQVPDLVVRESEVQTYESCQKMAEFWYSCIGYSIHMRKTGKLTEKRELPFCVGLEILLKRKAEESGSDNVLAHSHRKEDDLTTPQPRPYKPAPAATTPAREEFLNRFVKSATLVASGVVKNANKVCNQIKSAIDDILYPYRKPPK